ncbi:hypothetical protein CYMTET_8109 [Cymbomonas tetramitiformis]|uniref:DUF4218 domain-containing protein n=1 Tax=Cymbomonas tetramitiformis TaxID=36881 RepID=A0AAE0GU67_9CHLO|nr:hypothetical protein CYMTET_8109 [Cymbomonas tetramitiformis]
MLRPNGTNTGPKTLKCHEALKMLQAGIMSVLASWDRDEGYSKNMLEDLIGQLTVITRELTSELVDCKDVPKLQNLVDEFFKSLERDGSSPDWLVINTHLLSHFPDQLLMYGPIRGTWMYVFESFNGKIRRWVKNNAYPVQSVMQGFGRYRMVHVVRGLILVLRRRREATTNPTRPPVLPFLATAPLRAPNTVVLGTQGKRHVLSRAETKALELWMHGNVPQYRKLKAKFDAYVTYCKRTRRRKLVNVTSEPFSLEKTSNEGEEIETDRYAMVDSIYKVDLAAKEYILVKGKWFPEFNQATTKRFAKLNSKYGPDNTAKEVYTYDPDDPETPWDTTDPFILAAQIEHQVVIKKHPVMKTAVVEYHTYLGRVGLHRWQLIKLWGQEGRAQQGFWPESDSDSFGEHALALLNDVYGESRLQHARYAMVGECPLTPGASYFEFAGVPRPGWAVPGFGEGLLRIRVYTTPVDGGDCHGWWGEVVLVRGPWAHPCLHYTNAFQSFFATSLHRDLTDAPTVASPLRLGLSRGCGGDPRVVGYLGEPVRTGYGKHGMQCFAVCTVGDISTVERALGKRARRNVSVVPPVCDVSCGCWAWIEGGRAIASLFSDHASPSLDAAMDVLRFSRMRRGDEDFTSRDYTRAKTRISFNVALSTCAADAFEYGTVEAYYLIFLKRSADNSAAKDTVCRLAMVTAYPTVEDLTMNSRGVYVCNEAEKHCRKLRRSNMTSVDMTGNQIKSISDSAFPPGLQILRMTGNHPHLSLLAAYTSMRCSAGCSISFCIQERVHSLAPWPLSPKIKICRASEQVVTPEYPLPE